MKKGTYFQIDRVQSKTDKETLRANKTLEKNRSSNDRLPKRGRGVKSDTADGDEEDDRYGKSSKQFQYVRVRFLSGQ